MLDVGNAAAADQSMHTLMFTPEHMHTQKVDQDRDVPMPAAVAPKSILSRSRGPLARRTSSLASVPEPQIPAVSFSDVSQSFEFPLGEPSNCSVVSSLDFGSFDAGKTNFEPSHLNPTRATGLGSFARFSSFKAPRRSTLAVATQLGTVLLCVFCCTATRMF